MTQRNKSMEERFEVHATCPHSDKYNFSCGDCIDKMLATQKEEIREKVEILKQSRNLDEKYSYSVREEGYNQAIDAVLKLLE